MRQLIDLPTLWREAAERLDGDRDDAGLTRATIGACPFALTDVLTVNFDLDRALSYLTAPPKPIP